ncbi:MAG: Rab family GTPase [Candidatus Hodarchaeota archaeon]
MNDNNQRFSFKITVIGDGRVGKTSLIKKFTTKSFKKEYIKTIGAEISVFDKKIEKDKVRLFFWDIAGQDDFHFLHQSFFKNSKATIIVYSLEENELGKESFKHIQDWNRDVQKYCGEIPVVLFANKVDLIDEQSLDVVHINKIVEENNFQDYFITSALTGQGVIDAFNSLIDLLYEKYKDV